MPPVAGSTHDCTLEVAGVVRGFMFAPGSYQLERADVFAPNIGSGDEPTLREDIWNVWSQDSAAEGIDQLTFRSKEKIYRSDGNVFLLRDKQIQLDALWATSGNAFDSGKTWTAPMCVDFRATDDYVVAGVSTKVRRYNATTGAAWADSTTTLGAGCKWLHRHNSYVFAALGDSNDFVRSSDLDTWANPGGGGAGIRGQAFCSWEYQNVNYLVLGGNLSSVPNIRLSSDDGATWGTAIPIGSTDANVTGLGVAGGLLVIGKEDGIYTYDGVQVVPVYVRPEWKYVGNCKALVYFDGFLYTHMLGKVLKLAFGGGGLSNAADITPFMWGDANKELWGHGIVVWLWAGPFNLYAAFDDGESVYPEVLYYTALGGWQQAYRGASGDNMNGGGYSRVANRTFINDGATRPRRHTSLKDTPFADYPSSGVFETSDFDNGLPSMYKAFRNIFLRCRNLSESVGRQITVAYSTDQGVTFTTIGTIKTSGTSAMLIDASAADPLGAVSAQTMRLRFTLTRGSTTTETPVVEWFQVFYLNRPDPLYAGAVALLLANGQELRDGSVEVYTVNERLAFLRDAEAALEPVTFIDDIGEKIVGYVTKMAIRRPKERRDSDERVVNLVLVEAYSSNRWDAIYWDLFLWR